MTMLCFWLRQTCPAPNTTEKEGLPTKREKMQNQDANSGRRTPQPQAWAAPGVLASARCRRARSCVSASSSTCNVAALALKAPDTKSVPQVDPNILGSKSRQAARTCSWTNPNRRAKFDQLLSPGLPCYNRAAATAARLFGGN